MRTKRPNVRSGQNNSPGDKHTMQGAITRILREVKDSLAEHPVLSVAVLLIMALLSAVELLDNVPLDHPTPSSRTILFIDQIDDLIAVGVMLFVAYRWRPRLGQLAAIFYLALHVPYVFFDLPDETYELARQGFMGITALLGIWLIDKLRQTQISLKTSEQKFRATVNSIPAGVCIAQDGKLCYVNPQFAWHTGYSEEELIDTDFLELVADDDRHLVRSNAREALLKGLPSSCEHRFVTKGGETRWVLQTAAPITYNGNAALIGSFVDITRRRLAEAEVRDRERRMEALYRISQAVTRSLALRDVADLALDTAVDVLRVDAGIIRYFDEAKQRLVLLAHRGLPAEAVQDMEAKPPPKRSHGASGLMLESETLVVIEDITTRTDLFYESVRSAGFVTFTGFPLKVNDRVIGTMATLSRQQRTFSPDDIETLSSLGNIIGVAMANARLFDELEERVRERTAEISNVNKALHAEIIEHERADSSIRVSHRLLEIVNLHTEMAPLVKDFVAEIRNFTGCAGAGVCIVDADDNPVYEAYDGFTQEFFEVENAACVRNKQCKCVSVVEGTVDKSSALYTEGGSFCINGITRFLREASGQEGDQAFEVCRRHGYESVALVPVPISDHARGFIQVADPRENVLPGDLVKTLEKAGLQLGIAIRRVMAESSAATDHLTGLFNHRHFVDRLEQEVARAHRRGGAFSLAMIDVDDFKKVNDTLGHMAGDRVLREVAGAIRRCIREYDVAFRYGGDEFALILPDADYDGAATTVDRIRKAIAEVMPAGIASPDVKLGLSGGIACFPEDSTNSQELIMMADIALYRAKQRGGNGTCRAAEPEASPVPDRSWETFRTNSVYALAAAVDAKDHHTFGHSGRVAALCTALGYRLGLSTAQVERLSSAALLHDIGKLSVSDKVLKKREDLTEREWQEVRRHPEHGVRIIEKIPQLTPIVPAILHHHERFDGLGYPSGVKGEDIPLEARIIAIVDAYDTMTSARSYRDVLSTEEALVELRRCAGTQFAPELVEAFAAMIIERQVKGLSVSPEC